MVSHNIVQVETSAGAKAAKSESKHITKIFRNTTTLYSHLSSFGFLHSREMTSAQGGNHNNHEFTQLEKSIEFVKLVNWINFILIDLKNEYG